MKRTRLLLAALALLLLSGCGQSAQERACLDFSQQLRERESLDFRALVTCEYPDRTVAFTLDYALRGEEQTVTVVEPRSIAGVQARYESDERKLVYKDLILELGEGEQGLDPARALPLLTEALREGHLDSCWKEDGAAAATYILDDRLTVEVRFAPEEMIPQAAELLQDGRTAVRCQISDWR